MPGIFIVVLAYLLLYWHIYFMPGIFIRHIYFRSNSRSMLAYLSEVILARRSFAILRQFGCDGVDEEGAFADEAEVGCGFFDEVADGGEIGVGGQEFEGEAFGGPELEGDALEAPRFIVEDFDVVLGVAEGGDALEVVGGVADVLVSGSVESGDGGGAEAEVVVADPVTFVVAGAFRGEGVVGCFVVFVAGGGEDFFAKGEHFGVEIGIVLVVAGLKFFEEGGVFFVGEIVGGKVFGLEGEGLGEGVFPIEEGLAGNGEDEVDIDLEVGGFAEEVDGGDGLHRGVFAAEGFEVLSKEGLHAKRDAGDAEVLIELGGAGGESGGVGFEGDFLDVGKVEGFAEAGEEPGEVGGREHRGGPATEVDGFDRGKVFLCGEAGFGEEGVDESAKVGFAGGVFVEGAIGADAVAKGDVEVEMHSLNAERRTSNTQR